jgi:vacuolar-type H+-ATPase subunit F/Vma7
VRVVCRPAVGAGFALAGLTTTAADGADEGTARVRELLADQGTGVLLLEAPLYEALPEDVRRDLGRRPLPMVVPFPAPSWQPHPGAADAHIVELLRQVIGYRVRLR